MKEVLEAKYPPPLDTVSEAFITADLPTLVDLDITEAHILKSAKYLSGGAGISISFADHETCEYHCEMG